MSALFDNVAANTSVKIPYILPEAVSSLTLYFQVLVAANIGFPGM